MLKDMSLKKTALLALILVAILLYIIRVVEPNKEAEKQAKFIFKELAQDKLSSMHVHSPQGDYTLVQIATPQVGAGTVTPAATTPQVAAPAPSIKWQLQGLENAPLDQAKISSIIAGITNLTSESVIEASDIESDKSLYGLTEPALTLDLKTANKSYTIKFGKENAYVGKRYVSIEPDGPALMLAPDNLLVSAAVKLDDIRSKMPIQFIDSEIKSIEVKADKAALKLVRAQNNAGWRMAAPIEAKASDAAVAQLLRDIKNLRTDEFIERTPKTLSANALDNASVELQIEFSSTQAPLSVKIAAAKAAKSDPPENKPAFFIVGDQPAIYKTANFDRATVVKTPLDLRDREMFNFDRTKLEKVTFQNSADASSRHELVKLPDGKWSIDTKPADAVFVGELIGNLIALKALDFQSAPAQGFEKPLLKLTLGFAGGLAEQTLTVGAETKPGSQQFFVRSSTRDEDFIIGADTLRLINPRTEALLAQATPTPASTTEPMNDVAVTVATRIPESSVESRAAGTAGG